MQIHVVHAANRHLYVDELAAFFHARYKIYVLEKSWRDTNEIALEIDQFDNDDATYLIGIENGVVMTGTRLVPTHRPHLLSEIFPQMCDISVRQPDVAEWTRGFIIPEYRERGIGLVKGQFCGTVMEYCLKEGITRVGGVQDLYWLPVWKRYSWNVKPIGQPAEIDGRWCVAAYFDVTPEARDHALRSGKLTRSILVEQGPHKPFIEEPSRVGGERKFVHAA